MTFLWRTRPTVVLVDVVDAYVGRVWSDIVANARRRAPEIARWMKANALWQDQTGDARSGLFSEVVEVSRDMLIVLFSHGLDISYSFFLEFSNAGRFQIIAPTLDHWAPILWRDMRALVMRG